jgi:Fungal specific transcription factor domain
MLQKLSMRMYFWRVNPILPILHRPTLQLTPENGALILSICSVGSLFLGTAEATRYGSVLFDRLLKAMSQSVRIYTISPERQHTN